MGKTMTVGTRQNPVRFSYANVFEPRAISDGQDPQYSVSILIDKKDKKTIKAIEAAIQAELAASAAKFGGKVPKKFKNPLRDGDEEREDNPEYQGMMFLNANSKKRKPIIVDENRDEILLEDEFYSGCYGRASVDFYAYNVEGSKGVAVGLNALQKLEDGEPLGGGPIDVDAAFGDDDFDDDLS